MSNLFWGILRFLTGMLERLLEAGFGAWNQLDMRSKGQHRFTESVVEWGREEVLLQATGEQLKQEITSFIRVCVREDSHLTRGDRERQAFSPLG